MRRRKNLWLGLNPACCWLVLVAVAVAWPTVFHPPGGTFYNCQLAADPLGGNCEVFEIPGGVPSLRFYRTSSSGDTMFSTQIVDSRGLYSPHIAADTLCCYIVSCLGRNLNGEPNGIKLSCVSYAEGIVVWDTVLVPSTSGHRGSCHLTLGPTAILASWQDSGSDSNGVWCQIFDRGTGLASSGHVWLGVGTGGHYAAVAYGNGFFVAGYDWRCLLSSTGSVSCTTGQTPLYAVRISIVGEQVMVFGNAGYPAVAEIYSGLVRQRVDTLSTLVSSPVRISLAGSTASYTRHDSLFFRELINGIWGPEYLAPAAPSLVLQLTTAIDSGTVVVWVERAEGSNFFAHAARLSSGGSWSHQGTLCAVDVLAGTFVSLSGTRLLAILPNGDGYLTPVDSFLVDAVDDPPSPVAPSSFEVRAYPNPFNGEVSIQYDVAARGPAKVELFNLVGQRVAILVDEQSVAPGSYVARWQPIGLASGVYLAKVESGARSNVTKIVYMR